MTADPRDVITTIIAHLVTTHGDLLSVQAAIERSALGSVFHENEIVDLQKLDHATQFVDAIATILRNFMTLTLTDRMTAIDLDRLLHDVKLGSIHSLFDGQTKPNTTIAGEMDFF